MTQRFPLIAPEAMTPEQKRVADAVAGGPRGGLRGPFPPLLHNPALMECVANLGEHLRFRTRIPPDLLEMAILVTARKWNAQYEWYAHEKLARKNNLDPAIIEAIRLGKTPSGLTGDAAIVYTVAAQVHRDGTPDDATFERARARFGYDGVLDLVALCGYYTTVAMLLNTARIAVPEGPQPLPPL